MDSQGKTGWTLSDEIRRTRTLTEPHAMIRESSRVCIYNRPTGKVKVSGCLGTDAPISEVNRQAKYAKWATENVRPSNMAQDSRECTKVSYAVLQHHDSIGHHNTRDDIDITLDCRPVIFNRGSAEPKHLLRVPRLHHQ